MGLAWFWLGSVRLPACLYIGSWHSTASHPPVSCMLHFPFFSLFFLVLSFLNWVSMSFSTAVGPLWPTKQTNPLVFFDFILSTFSLSSPSPSPFPFLSLSVFLSLFPFSFSPSCTSHSRSLSSFEIKAVIGTIHSFYQHSLSFQLESGTLRLYISIPLLFVQSENHRSPTLRHCRDSS